MTFEKVKKNFGFGCMRLPMDGEKVEYKEFCEMVDYFLANGFNYFDTAHGYLKGESELAIRDCLVARHSRESFTLTDKLTDMFFENEEDIRPFFAEQLACCGVEYFDFYLMHSLSRKNFEKYVRCHAFETAFALKREGKIRHVGISFHDTADLLDEILTRYPEIELVQIQFNYLDYNSPSIQSRLCYEVCVKHGKPVVAMEPVKGGTLANLPEEAEKHLLALHGGSPASYAIRYCAGFENMFMVISGMSTIGQMKDNVSFMKEFKPLTVEEKDAIARTLQVLSEEDFIPCTACRYCTDGCPAHISIPDLFACMNQKKRCKEHDWNSGFYYSIHTTGGKGKASACIECGKCEISCPQNLKIRELLKAVAAQFEKH